MVSLKKVSNEFDVPKIRESFMRQFLNDTEFNLNLDETSDVSKETESRKTSASSAPKKSLGI